MKTLKKRILTLVICICMLMGTLTGCSLIIPNKAKALEADAVKIGSTVLTKQEVVDLWYSFYNENSSYFYYYDENQILDIFYQNIISKYAIIEEVNKLREDDKLFYTESNEAKVWSQVLDYFSDSLDGYEKALYTQKDIENEDLPTRLQSEETASSSEEDEVKSYLYEEYHFAGMEDYVCENLTGTDLTKVGENVERTTVEDMIDLLKVYLYKVPAEVEEDEDVKYENLSDLKTKVQSLKDIINTEKLAEKDSRQRAYDMYLGNLLLSNKANGKTQNKAETLYNEVKRVYVNYYETYLYNMYSSYIKAQINNEESIHYSLSDETILLRYLQLLGKDIQDYKVEENYIAVVEAKANNTLLLYYYEGEYYYFSVQHLLVSFDDEITDYLKTIPGSDASADIRFDELNTTLRNNSYSKYGYASWGDYDNATYRDENGYSVYYITSEYLDAGNRYVYYDKDYEIEEVETEEGEEVDEDTLLTKYFYYTTEGDTTSEKVYLTKGLFKKCNPATVTINTVLTEFNNSYNNTIGILSANMYDSTSALSLDEQAEAVLELLKANDNISYTISKDLVKAYISASSADVQTQNSKVYTNLFMQHAFKYSADSASLGNELSNYVGMIISAEADNHTVGGSTYVAEFTNGARRLVQDYLNNGHTALSSNNFVLSDYGLHIIVVNDVYAGNQAITGDSISYNKIYKAADGSDLDETTLKANIANAVNVMKNTYVCSASSQTIYEYVYELIRDELIGDSGTLFTKVRNEIYSDYNKDSSKLNHYYKFTYNELMELIG